MPIDLFKDDLLHVAGSVLYDSIAAFTCLSEPEQNRPREGFTLDFKECWSDRALHTVAAFAHTFGGLLIVGVSEKDGLPERFVGVESTGELKTSIASSIGTNLSPTPQYEIAECSLPSEPGKKLAVVRVRKGNELYYYTKKGERYPIYVRNEDESLPANAAQLRALIEQRLHPFDPQDNLSTRVQVLRSGAYFQRTNLSGSNQPTNFQIFLIPLSHPELTLDSSTEEQFRNIVHESFPLLQQLRNKQNLSIQEGRFLNWYRYEWFLADENYEILWMVTSTGDIGFTTQVRFNVGGVSSWSLADRVADLSSILKTALAFWKFASYFGEARLLAELRVEGLRLYKHDHTRAFPLSYKPDFSLNALGVTLFNGHTSILHIFAPIARGMISPTKQGIC